MSNDNSKISSKSNFFWNAFDSAKKTLNSAKNYLTGNSLEIPYKIKDKLPEISESSPQNIYNSLLEHDKKFTNELKNKIHNLDFKKLTSKDIEKWDPIVFCVLGNESSDTISNILQKLHSANKSLTTEQKKMLMPAVEKILLEKGNRAGKFNKNVKMLIENLTADELQYFSEDFLSKMPYMVITKFNKKQINSFSQKQLDVLLNREDISGYVIANVTIDKLQNSSCKIGFYSLCERLGSQEILNMESSELEKITPKNLKLLLKFIYESSKPKGVSKFSDDQLGIQKFNIHNFIFNPQKYGISEQDLDYLVTYLNQNDIEQMFPVENLQNNNIKRYETVITKFKSEQIHYFSPKQVEALLKTEKLPDFILKNLRLKQLKTLSPDTIIKLVAENKLPGSLKLDNEDKNKAIKIFLWQLGILPTANKNSYEWNLNSNQDLNLSQDKIKTAKKLLNTVTDGSMAQYQLTIEAIDMLSEIKNNATEGIKNAFKSLDDNKGDNIRLQFFTDVLAKNITPEIAKSLSKDQISKLIELGKINVLSRNAIDSLNKDEIQKLSEQEIKKIIELHNKNYYTSHLNRLIPKFKKDQIVILLNQNSSNESLTQGQLEKIDPQILFDKDIIKLIPAQNITKLISTINENTNDSNKKNNLEHLIKNSPKVFNQDQINILIASDNIKYFTPEFLIELDSKQIKTFDTNSLTEQQLNEFLSSKKFQYLNKDVITENKTIDSLLEKDSFPLNNLSEEQKKCLITSGKFLRLYPDIYNELIKEENYKNIANEYIQNITFKQAQKIFPNDTLKTLIGLLAPNNQIQYLKKEIFERFDHGQVRRINTYISKKNNDLEGKENEFLTDDQFEVLFEKNLIIDLDPNFVVSKLKDTQIQQISYVYINTNDQFNNNLIFTRGESYPTRNITIDQLIALSKTEKFKNINPDLFKLASAVNSNKWIWWNISPKEKLEQLSLEHATAEQILVLFSNEGFSPTEQQKEQARKKFSAINFENMPQYEIDFYISKDFFKPTENQIKQFQDIIDKKIASMNDGENREQEITDDDKFIDKVLNKIGSQKAKKMLDNIDFSKLSIKRIAFYISRESFIPTEQQISQLIKEINKNKGPDTRNNSDYASSIDTFLKKIAPYITQKQFQNIGFDNLYAYQINSLFYAPKKNNKNISFASDQILSLTGIINRYQNDDVNGIGRLNSDILKKMSNQITLEQLEKIKLNKLSSQELDSLFNDCKSIIESKNSKEVNNFFSKIESENDKIESENDKIESENDDELINKLLSSNNFKKLYLNVRSPSPNSNIDSIILMENKPDFTKTKLFLRMFQNHLENNTQQSDSENQPSETQKEAYTKFINDLDDEAFQKFDFSKSDGDITEYLPIEKLLTLSDMTNISEKCLNKLQNKKIEIQKWASNLNWIFGIGGFVYMFFKNETLNKIDDKIQSWQNQKNQNIESVNQKESQMQKKSIIPRQKEQTNNQQQTETSNSSSIFDKVKKAWHRAWENHEEQK